MAPVKRPISLSVGEVQTRYGDERTLEMARRAGFDAVDMDVMCYGRGQLPDVYHMPEDQFEEYFTRIRRRAEQLGLAIAHTHNIMSAYRPNDAAYNKELLMRCKKGIQASRLLGCRYTVTHCINSYRWGDETPPEVMHRENQRMFADFLDVIEQNNVCAALESFGRSTDDHCDCFGDARRMLQEYESLPTRHKAFCLDSGHTHTVASMGQPTVPEFIRLFGSRIRLVHLHDNDGLLDQHLIPGQGTINWPEVFDALEEIGYQGYFNYEIILRWFGQSIPQAIEFLGSYLRDFTDRRGR